MNYKYDKETNTMAIELPKEKPDFAEQKGDIITHYNKQNKPIEIEILNASKATLEMLKLILPAKVEAVKA